MTIQFTPHLIPVNRGILTTLYLAPEKHFSNAAEMKAFAEKNHRVLQSAYGERAFRAIAGRQSACPTQKM